jgi:hypothetical protein
MITQFSDLNIYKKNGMNALELIQKSHGRQLVINLPAEFVNTELKIIILRSIGDDLGNVTSRSAQHDALAVARFFWNCRVGCYF